MIYGLIKQKEQLDNKELHKDCNFCRLQERQTLNEKNQVNIESLREDDPLLNLVDWCKQR